MARPRGKTATKVVKPKKDELEELEDELEDLDEEESEDTDDILDEDDEVEDDEEEEDEDEEEAPKARRKAKTKARAAKDGIGSAELAELLETNGRNLRVMLRDRGKNASDYPNNRYHWKNQAAALKDLGFSSLDDAMEAIDEARDTRLDALKENQAKKRAATKTTKKGRRAKAVEVDEDEDEE
jgi:hypothetical protein